MKLINTNRSYNGWAPFLLFFAIVAIIMTIIAIITSNFDDFLFSFILPFMFFLFILPSLFFIDIFLWHFFGKEIICINATEIEIRKTGRLFKRRKKIKLCQIKDVYLWQKNIRDIHILLAFWDLSRQGTICLKYKNNKKYYVGVNMSNREAIELRKELVHGIFKHEVPI